MSFFRLIKIVIRKSFNIFGLDIKKKLNLSFDEIYKKKFKNPIIFDVGANEGQSVKRFNLIFPKCIIHSFEPIKSCFNNIKNSYSGKRFLINNFALGERKGKKNFFINKYLGTSSLLKINKKYKELNGNKVVNNLNIKIMTLDQYVNLNKIKKIDILKIDVQGYEINVLKGAKKSLKKGMIKFIELEIIFNDYYERNVKLHEIDSIMCKNNFNLFDINEIRYDNDNKIKWLDMLYFNKNLYN